MRILLYCWEVGSARALSPVVDLAISEGVPVDNFSTEPGVIVFNHLASGQLRPKSVIRKSKTPAAVLAGLGHPTRTSEWERWSAIKGLAPSIVVLDHWKGLERFIDRDGALDHSRLPDKICVIDDLVRDYLLSLGIPTHTIEIVGNLSAIKLGTSRLTKCTGELNGGPIISDGSTPIIFLASETIHNHPFHDPCNELCFPLEEHRTFDNGTVLDFAIREAAAIGGRLLLRPHPNQPIPKDLPDHVSVVPWNLFSDDQLLECADKVIGLSSMIVAKAVSEGIHVQNVSEYLDGWTANQSFLDSNLWLALIERGIFKNSNAESRGCSRVAASPESVLSLTRSMAKLL